MVANHSGKIIKSSVSIHDRTQVETIFSYYLDSKDENKLPAEQQYRVDAFIFFPVQTGINPTTYTRQQFYNDLRALIRLREPRLTYRELLGESTSNAASLSPLVFVQNFVARLKKGEEDDRIRLATDEARVFGCSFVSYFWRRVERRTRRMVFLHDALRANQGQDRKRVSDHFVKNTIKFFEKGFGLLRIWRQLTDDVRNLGDLSLKPLLFEMELVDEYLAYCFRDGLLRVLKGLDECHESFDTDSTQLLRYRIKVHLRYERKYARVHNFSWVNEESDHVLKENYVYRRGALKRRIWSVLYLNPRQELIFKFQKQVGPMFAAGLASGWALIASLFIWSRSDFRGFQFMNALSMGSLVFITTMFIFAYVLKDRIKEFGRTWFERGLFRTGPDLANAVYYYNADGEKLRIGFMKESVDFIKAEKIPEAVLMLRKLHLQKHYKFDDAYGAVIHYRKAIKLTPRKLTRLQQPIRAVHDILRLNISSFLARLDDPLHLSLTLDSENRAVECLMPKVYHIDLVLKYWPLVEKGAEQQPLLDYYRIVVDKKGMSRIEQLK